MALKYTGRASVLQIGDKVYARDKLEFMNTHGGAEPDGTFEQNLPISKEAALNLMESSNLHSFEESGDDLLEKITTPNAPAVSQRAAAGAALDDMAAKSEGKDK